MRSFRDTVVLAVFLSLTTLGIVPIRAASEPVAHLAWDECGASGVVTRTFACNTNAGAEQLVVSFVAPAAPAFTGIEARVRIWSPAAAFPAWWSLAAGGCRSGSLKASPFAAGSTACTSPWTSQVFWSVDMDPVTRELRAVVDLNKGQEHALDPAVEYYGVRFAIDHAKSAGGGACDGCAMPAGIYLSRLVLLLGADPNYEYAFSQVPFVNWQCDGAPTLAPNGSGWDVTGWSFPDCATPARRPTWGAIQSLYR